MQIAHSVHLFQTLQRRIKKFWSTGSMPQLFNLFIFIYLSNPRLFLMLKQYRLSSRPGTSAKQVFSHGIVFMSPR